MKWYLDVLKNYATFTGRARRTEYWMFQLINVAIILVLELLIFLLPREALVFAAIPVVLYALAVLVPNIAVTARRLHDTGRSGWWMLISFVPFVGGIVLLVFTVMDSEPQPNMHGPNPKTMAPAYA